jgi:hypothetical protein
MVGHNRGYNPKNIIILIALWYLSPYPTPQPPTPQSQHSQAALNFQNLGGQYAERGALPIHSLMHIKDSCHQDVTEEHELWEQEAQNVS